MTFDLILRRLVAQGVTILMVSHDVPFCAEYAHKCGLFFDGSIVAEGNPESFSPVTVSTQHLLTAWRVI